MNKIFAFLQEPASYTIDRNLNVYVPLGINYCYLKQESKAKSITKEGGKIDYLSTMTRFQQFHYIRKVLRANDKIIYNGYADWGFLILFFLNFWYRKAIGIDSDTQYREPSNKITRLIKRSYLKLIFGNKHIYGLAGGSQTHKDLFRNFGMKEERILLMPMMVNNQFFDDPHYMQKQHTDCFHFLYVGRLIECKNIEFMINAFIKYHTLHPKSQLHIVGKGYLEEKLKKQFAKYEFIFFEGAKYGNELIKTYHNNHALILPSNYEPWGLVVNEAMSAGLPALVSEEVGARYDLVKEGQTGFVFNSTDEKSLISAMIKVSDTTLYKEYAHNAYSLMHKFWNYNLYQKCLEKFIHL